MKTRIINKSAHVLELQGASGAVGLRYAQTLARKTGKPVLAKYDRNTIIGVQTDGCYYELPRDTWQKEDALKPFRYLPGRYFSGTVDFDRQMARLTAGPNVKMHC